MLACVLQWLSLHGEILIMLLSQFPLTFPQTQKGIPVSLYSLWWFSSWLVSGQATLISMVFSCLCCCHSSKKLIFLFAQSDRLVIVAKGFKKLPNLHMLIKQKSLSLPRNVALGTFGKSLIVFSTKINLLYLLYSTARRCYLLHLIKQNCLLKFFLR